jgi:AcrR family transcriptional regulator
MPIERVVQAALELIDEVGPAQFSMRLLAQRLGSSTATLYRHFAGKDEIFVYVVDQVLGEVPPHVPATTSTANWREHVLAGVEALFRTLKAHPNVVTLLDNHIPLGPRGLAAREASLGILISSGFPPELAARAYTALGHYVIGFASQLRAHRADNPENDEDIRAYFGSLDPARYPATVNVAPFTPISLDDEFRFGLRLVLDGLATQLAGPGQNSDSG